MMMAHGLPHIRVYVRAREGVRRVAEGQRRMMMMMMSGRSCEPVVQVLVQILGLVLVLLGRRRVAQEVIVVRC
jgi:hypothetical protein